MELGFIKIVRMLRILRPLRFISHNPSMKILVNSLLESLVGLSNVSLVILLIWLMFGILFMNLLAGNSGICFVLGMDPTGVSKTACDGMGGRWISYD